MGSDSGDESSSPTEASWGFIDMVPVSAWHSAFHSKYLIDDGIYRWQTIYLYQNVLIAFVVNES